MSEIFHAYNAAVDRITNPRIPPEEEWQRWGSTWREPLKAHHEPSIYRPCAPDVAARFSIGATVGPELLLCPCLSNGVDEGQRRCSSVRFAFFEITGLAHLVRDVRETQHRLGVRLCKGIERRRLHLDC